MELIEKEVWPSKSSWSTIFETSWNKDKSTDVMLRLQWQMKEDGEALLPTVPLWTRGTVWYRDLRIRCLHSNRIPNRIRRYDSNSNRIGHSYITHKATSTLATTVAVFGNSDYSRRKRRQIVAVSGDYCCRFYDYSPTVAVLVAEIGDSSRWKRRLFSRFWPLYSHRFLRLKRRLQMLKMATTACIVAQCGRGLSCSTTVRRNTNRIGHSGVQ